MSSELSAALVAALAEMPAVEPNATNPHFKSKFVSLAHLIAKTRPVLNKHGLAIIQAPTNIDGKPALSTTVVHVSGESLSSVMPLILAKDDMQGVGAAITYARRYAWAAALGIAGEEDDDGEAASNGRRRKKEPADVPERLASNWRQVLDALNAANVTDGVEWMKSACLTLGIATLEDASIDQKVDVLARMNVVLGALEPWADSRFPPPSVDDVQKAFAAGFDGVILEPPTDPEPEPEDEDIPWPEDEVPA